MSKVKNPIFKCMHRGEKGFTLIELLVVIAILGVIAAVVALNIAGFFGRGTLQAANTELHQAQTAIISAMADAETNNIFAGNTTPDADGNILWAGEEGWVLVQASAGNSTDAASYVYGPFRAVYAVDDTGAIVDGWCYDHGSPPANLPGNPWGPTIIWDADFSNWRAAEEGDYPA
ncbi:MAG: type II secretion system protein [Dehalococcoidia bacterium]